MQFSAEILPNNRFWPQTHEVGVPCRLGNPRSATGPINVFRFPLSQFLKFIVFPLTFRNVRMYIQDSLLSMPWLTPQYCRPGCLTVHSACEISPVYKCSCCCWCLSLHFNQFHFMYTRRLQHCFFARNNSEYFYRLITKSEVVSIGNPALSTVNRSSEVANEKNGWFMTRKWVNMDTCMSTVLRAAQVCLTCYDNA